MEGTKEILQTTIDNIIKTSGEAVCKELPKMMEEKSPEIFNKVIETLTEYRNRYREQIVKDFKEGIISKLLGDESIANMLKEIVIKGTEEAAKLRVTEGKKTRHNGGQLPSINKSKKRKINTIKYRKSLKKI
jgi:flagellar biosynthesis chaperone FliJ